MLALKMTWNSPLRSVGLSSDYVTAGSQLVTFAIIVLHYSLFAEAMEHNNYAKLGPPGYLGEKAFTYFERRLLLFI